MGGVSIKLKSKLYLSFSKYVYNIQNFPYLFDPLNSKENMKRPPYFLKKISTNSKVKFKSQFFNVSHIFSTKIVSCMHFQVNIKNASNKKLTSSKATSPSKIKMKKKKQKETIFQIRCAKSLTPLEQGQQDCRIL